MYIWLALFFPVIGIILMYIFFRVKVAWWESSVLLLIIIGFIAAMKYGTETSQTSDVEYIQDYVVRVEHYDAWDEEVSCRHPKYCQEYNSCKSRNSKGDCEGGYETVQCGYEHLYDVDYHSEYWEMITNSNNSFGIDKETWYRLKEQFKATPIFYDMHRDYHSIDGDMQYFVWDKQIPSIEYVVTTHHYENRVQAAHSVLNFPEVDTTYIKLYNIIDYPKISDLYAPALLGYDNVEIDKYINQTNSLYAANKQAKVFYLIYKNKPRDAAFAQEQYWKGGNKNEINICIGIDDNKNIKWCYVFSWTKQEMLKIKIRDYINNQKVLSDDNFMGIIIYSNSEIIDKFQRREFKEFSYLTVEPTKSAVIWTYILSFMLTIGLCIWIVMNNIDSDGINYGSYGNGSSYYNRYK